MDLNNNFAAEEDLNGTLNEEETSAIENAAEDESFQNEDLVTDVFKEISSETENIVPEDENEVEEDETCDEGESDKDKQKVSEKESPGSEEHAENGIESITLGELYTLCNEFPEEKVASDVVSESFKIFASGRKGDTNDIYKDYLKLKKCFENSQEPANVRSHSGFDSYGKAINQTHNLTKRQMQIARESGMSFSEYSELLQSIPSKGKRVLS